MCLSCHVCGLTPGWREIRVRKGELIICTALGSWMWTLDYICFATLFFNDKRKWYSAGDESFNKIASTLNRLLKASQLWFICKTISSLAAFAFETNKNKSFLLATEMELHCKLVAAHRWLCVRAVEAQNGMIRDWGKVSNVCLIEPNNVVRSWTEFMWKIW